MRWASKAMGNAGSSARRVFPPVSAKRMSSGDFWTTTVVLAATMRTSVLESSIFTAGGCGGSITAQEKSFGKLPCGATRTRTIPSLNAVMRTFARPAVSSTPSLSFSTRCTVPRCCQPSAEGCGAHRPSASRARLRRFAKTSMNFSPVCEARGLTILPEGTLGARFSRGASSRKPVLEKRGSLGAFDAAAHRVHRAAAQESIAIECEPVRNVQFHGLRRDFQLEVAHLEEALLENDAQKLFAQQRLGARRWQGRRDPVARLDGDDFVCIGHAGKCEEVQRVVHRVHGEKACVHAPAHLVIHPVQRVGHIGSGDALQRSAAHTPIETRKACGGKFAQGIFLSDVWPKNLDWACVHRISVSS